MATGCIGTIMLTTWLIIGSSVSGGHNTIGVYSAVLISARRYFQSDCVHFLASRDIGVNSEIVSTQRRLSDHGIPSAVINTTSVIDNSHRLLTSCNRPIYTIFDHKDAIVSLKMISKSNKLSRRRWLLFLQDSSNLDEYFLDINIPFDCEFIVVTTPDSDDRIGLTEVYRVAEQLPLQEIHIGSFSCKEDLVWPKVGFYDRRSDLNEIVLKMSIMGWGLFSLATDVAKNRTVIGGFDGKMLDILERHMNFKSDQEVPRDGAYGALLPNGSWSGIIGDVHRKITNMSGVHISISSERLSVASFSIPYVNEFARIHIQQPGRNVSLGSLVSPFSLKLWLALFVSAVGLSIGLAQFYKVDGDQRFRDIVFEVFCAIFCQQGSPEICRTSPKRLLVFLVYLLGIVVLSSYSCFFISSLTTYTPKLPFTSLKGLLDDGSYSLGMLKSGMAIGEFRNAKKQEREVFHKLYEKNIAPHPENIVSTMEEGIENICNSKYAFICEEKTLQFMDATCKIVSLDDYFTKRNNALVFSKDSPYIEIFNNKLLKLMSSGVIKKHLKDMFHKPSKLEYNTLISASFETVIPIISFGAVGALVSLLVLALELLKCHLCSSNVRTCQDVQRQVHPSHHPRVNARLRRLELYRRGQIATTGNY